MLSDANLSPKTKAVQDIDARIKNLQNYESWGTPTNMDFESIVGKEVWDQHWENWEKVQKIIRESQLIAEKINIEVAHAYEKL